MGNWNTIPGINDMIPGLSPEEMVDRIRNATQKPSPYVAPSQQTIPSIWKWPGQAPQRIDIPPARPGDRPIDIPQAPITSPATGRIPPLIASPGTSEWQRQRQEQLYAQGGDQGEAERQRAELEMDRQKNEQELAQDQQRHTMEIQQSAEKHAQGIEQQQQKMQMANAQNQQAAEWNDINNQQQYTQANQQHAQGIAQQDEQHQQNIDQQQQQFDLEQQQRQMMPTGLEQEQEQLAKLKQPGKTWGQLGTGGKIGRVLSTIGNIAGDVVAPRVMGMIPQTQFGRQIEEERLQSDIERQQQIANQGLEAQARMLTAQQGRRGQPMTIQDPADPNKSIDVLPDPNRPGQVIPMTISGQIARPGAPVERPRYTMPSMTVPGPGGKQVPFTIEERTGQITQHPELAGAEPLKEGTPPHITVMGPDQRPHIMERDPQTGQYSIDRGEAPPTTPVQGPQTPYATPVDPTGGYGQGFRYGVARAGEEIPPGALPPQKAEEAAAALQDFQGKVREGQDYVKSGKFTGSDDYQLVMGFVDATKPGGFRLNRFEFGTVLDQTRNMVDGVQARIKRAIDPNAPLLSAQQRQNFVNTMTRALQYKPGAGGGGGVGGGTQRFKVGNDYFNIPADKVERFRQANPQAVPVGQ